MEPIQVVVRDYNPNLDDPFIYSTWTRNAYYGMKPRPKPKGVWFGEKIRAISDLLANSTTVVATLNSDPLFILGYCVANQDKTEYLYIKKDYRDQGIEELLTKKLKETHETRKASQVHTDDLTDRTD